MNTVKELIKRTVVYDLPLLGLDFHAHKKLDIKPSNRKAVYKNFGKNFWDLVESGYLQRSKYAGFGLLDIGLLNIDKGNSPGTLLMNCSNNIISVKNEENGDIYNVGPLSIVTYNGYGQDIITAKISHKEIRSIKRSKSRSKFGLGLGLGLGLKKGHENNKVSIKDLEKEINSRSNSVWIHCVRFGDAYFVFLKFDDIVNGIVSVTELPLYNNILLCSGLINEDQYLKSASLNGKLAKAMYDENNNIYIDDDNYMDGFVYLLQDQWALVNPETVQNYKKNKNETIPHKIHWIWLSYELGHKNKEAKEGSIKQFEQFMKTWIIRNPTFEFNVWTNRKKLEIPESIKDKIIIRNLQDINNTIDLLKGTKLNKIRKNIDNIIHNHPNVGVRSDTLRQTILYTIGGLYADINDMACLVPFSTFLDAFDFICGLEPMIYINNAIIGSRKNHPISERFLDSIAYETERIFEDYPRHQKTYKNEDDKNQDREERDNFVVSVTGPIAFSSVIYGCLSDENINKQLDKTCIFPAKFFYGNYQITEDSCSWLSPLSLTAHFDARSFV